MTNEELVELYQGGDKNALEDLIEQNKGLVYKLVNKFYTDKTNSFDIEDLEQEGIMGLMIAAAKYDFNNEKKASFSTYAFNWIYSKIQRFVTQKNTNDETSLNIQLGNDGDAELMNTIEDMDYAFENVEEQIYIGQLRSELEQAMYSNITLMEIEVIKLHYGWDIKKMSYEDVGELLNVSSVRIQTIELKALRKLRNSAWGLNRKKEFVKEKLQNIEVDNQDQIAYKIDFIDEYFDCIV